MAVINVTPLNKTDEQNFPQKCLLKLRIFFLNSYLTAPRPTLGHSREGSLTNLILITAFAQKQMLEKFKIKFSNLKTTKFITYISSKNKIAWAYVQRTQLT